MEKLYEYLPRELVTFVLVTLFSLLIGLSQRKISLKREGETTLFGTDRTFTFIGILGYLLYILDPVEYRLFMGGGAILGLLLGLNYYVKQSQFVFISVRECDKPKAVVCAHQLHQAGFPLVATAGTAHVIQQAGIPCRTVGRIGDAAGDVIGMMEAGDITLVIMSVAEHEGELNDARAIRKLALAKQITYYTTMAGGLAASEGIRHMRSVQVYDLQGLHAGTLP